jgi:hypothetical protein
MARSSDSPDIRFGGQLVLGLVTALACDPELRQVIRTQLQSGHDTRRRDKHAVRPTVR